MPSTQEPIGGLLPRPVDSQIESVLATLRAADPHGLRMARVFRATFDQLYDGEHTGRYRVEQLFKTEKTHFGTLIEINLRREFDGVIGDGGVLDYEIAGHDVDCKFSFRQGGWMLPPECFDRLLLVCTADDALGVWSAGVVRATEGHRRGSVNRDGKTSLNTSGRESIEWLFRDETMLPNVLLSIDEDTRNAILAGTSGQARLDELFRRVTNRRIGRNTVATVAQQKDYMKRVRGNGGSRSKLAPEGYIIPGGYESHQAVALQLGIEVPQEGEFVSVRVIETDGPGDGIVMLEDRYWRAARKEEDTLAKAPKLPTTTNQNQKRTRPRHPAILRDH